MKREDQRRPAAIPRAARWIAGGIGFGVGVYAAYAGLAWVRYGRASPPEGPEEDPLLDRFMPAYEVVERHHVRVAAPADVTLAAATEVDLSASPIVEAIVAARAWLLGATPDEVERPGGLLAWARSLGWGVLAETPAREVVVGAATQPWKADAVFRTIPPEEFAAFQEPEYVKIAWTLRADPIGPTESVFRTETRVTTTDAHARARFRWYWTRFSPGIVVIRLAMLPLVKAEAERRVARQQADAGRRSQ